jgi:hypothetical protein
LATAAGRATFGGMEIEERVIKQAMAATSLSENGSEALWFAARQPGIVKYLETRCVDPDALGVAILATLTMYDAFVRVLGKAPPRLASQALDRAEARVVAEVQSGGPSGFAQRQRGLSAFIADMLASPPVTLGEVELNRLAVVLATMVDALDGAAFPAELRAGA